METDTTYAQIPPDAELKKAGIDTDVLRGANYQHFPPKTLIDVGPERGAKKANPFRPSRSSYDPSG